MKDEREPTPPPVKCENCGHLFDADCVKRSQLTSEFYCTEGQDSCWEIQAKEHEIQQREFGYDPTPFC